MGLDTVFDEDALQDWGQMSLNPSVPRGERGSAAGKGESESFPFGLNPKH